MKFSQRWKARLGGLVLGWLLMAGCSEESLRAQEVQHHGLVFERWIADTFFKGYRPGYTDAWDIPAIVNRDWGGIPVNPKAVKYGTSVDLGDALRQYDIAEPYLLVLGYWEQRGDYKHFTRVVALRMEPEIKKKLWHPVTREDLQRLDTLIKNRSLDYRDVRRRALEIKNQPPFTEAVISVHPKIDGHGQRRLQCSLSFAHVFEYLAEGEDPSPQEKAVLWGQPVPSPIFSPPRRFSSE
ncbi:MAG: hypothetical protein ACFCUX_01430 [Candidatus Methylacidiphilales bacterium]